MAAIRLKYLPDMKSAGISLGLLFNRDAKRLKDDIRRVVL
jgi:hypothetical protein